MLNSKQPQDYVIATGRTESLEYFIRNVFEYFDLNWQDYVELDKSLLRPSDILVGRADPTKAEKYLGWKPISDIDGVIENMCKAAVAAQV
jgi:GDPmannose 4,6-dehydratase